jgi:hypothetical protein
MVLIPSDGRQGGQLEKPQFCRRYVNPASVPCLLEINGAIAFDYGGGQCGQVGVARELQEAIVNT